MGAEYPALCGICGQSLADDFETRYHMPICYLFNKPLNHRGVRNG